MLRVAAIGTGVRVTRGDWLYCEDSVGRTDKNLSGANGEGGDNKAVRICNGGATVVVVDSDGATNAYGIFCQRQPEAHSRCGSRYVGVSRTDAWPDIARLSMILGSQVRVLAEISVPRDDRKRKCLVPDTRERARPTRTSPALSVSESHHRCSSRPAGGHRKVLITWRSLISFLSSNPPGTETMKTR